MGASSVVTRLQLRGCNPLGVVKDAYQHLGGVVLNALMALDNKLAFAT